MTYTMLSSQLLHLSQNIACAKHGFEIAFIRPVARSYVAPLIKKHLYYKVGVNILIPVFQWFWFPLESYIFYSTKNIIP